MNKLLRTTIKSISFSNTEIIKNILDLHVPSHKIDLDPCYSTGVFYNSGFIPQPTLKYDIYIHKLKVLKKLTADTFL